VTFKAAFTTLNQTRFTFQNDRITTTNITGVHIQYSVLLPCAKTKAVLYHNRNDIVKEFIWKQPVVSSYIGACNETLKKYGYISANF
jgi:hypothetical protein